MPAVLRSQAKTGGNGQLAPSIAHIVSGGSTRGMFSSKPPPVICANAFTPPARIAARQLFT
jgi:hypothetical protein